MAVTIYFDLMWMTCCPTSADEIPKKLANWFGIRKTDTSIFVRFITALFNELNFAIML